MKIPTLILATLMMLAPALSGQNCTLSGKVTDIHSGKAIPYANIGLFKKGLLVTGSSADENGMYRIDVLKPGNYEVRVSFIGYVARLIPVVKITADAHTRVNYSLKRMGDGPVVLQSQEQTAELGHLNTDQDSINKSQNQWKFYKKY